MHSPLARGPVLPGGWYSGKRDSRQAASEWQGSRENAARQQGREPGSPSGLGSDSKDGSGARLQVCPVFELLDS